MLIDNTYNLARTRKPLIAQMKRLNDFMPAPTDFRTCCRCLDSGKIFSDLRSKPGDHKQQPQDMRGRGPGRWRVRLFTDFWRENLNFPALRIINRRAGGRGAVAREEEGGGGVL